MLARQRKGSLPASPLQGSRGPSRVLHIPGGVGTLVLAGGPAPCAWSPLAAGGGGGSHSAGLGATLGGHGTWGGGGGGWGCCSIGAVLAGVEGAIGGPPFMAGTGATTAAAAAPAEGCMPGDPTEDEERGIPGEAPGLPPPPWGTLNPSPGPGNCPTGLP